MLFLWISQGKDVQAGAVGPMMLGSLSVSAYSMFFAEFVMEIYHRFYDDNMENNLNWNSFLCVAFAVVLAYFSAVVVFTVPVFAFFHVRNYYANLQEKKVQKSEDSNPILHNSNYNNGYNNNNSSHLSFSNNYNNSNNNIRPAHGDL